MDWFILNGVEQLDEINSASFQKPQLIFKHSIRCSISAVIKNRLHKGALPSGIDFYHLDLIAHRNISNKIAENYGVPHESPQVLLIKDGKCVFNESHHAIYLEEIIEEAQTN